MLLKASVQKVAKLLAPHVKHASGGQGEERYIERQQERMSSGMESQPAWW
jgi:hypothetical protein